MSGQLSNKGEELALNAVFKGQTVYVGLSRSSAPLTDTSTLSSVTEVTDTAYSRKVITFGNVAQEGGVGVLKNTVQIDFAPWNANSPSNITAVFLTYSATGTSGDIIAYYNIPLASQIQPLKDDPVKIPVNGLTIGLN